jgi:hypothetical protein
MSKHELVQFGNLKRDHFEAFPVWASCHSFDYDEEWFDETDEETFRPWEGRMPVDPAEGMFLVLCTLTLSDGTELHGFFNPQAGPEPLNLGTIQPYVFLPGGTVFGFWFGMKPCDQNDRTNFYRALSKSPSEVFPVHFAARPGLTSGATVSGEIAGFYWTPDLRLVKVET